MRNVNWLDRVIGFVAPATAARRVKARTKFDQLRRSYAGAALGRHTDGWKAFSTSADAEIAVGGQRLRDRARDLVRNNPGAAKAVSVFAAVLIGHGITPRPNTGDETKNKRIKEAFFKWARQCDADGQLDFFGLQTLAVREMIEGGEVLARRRWRRAGDGLDVPVQIQIFEVDHLDGSKNGALENGRYAVSGIEFDQIGRRTAYWMFKEHPGAHALTSLTGAYASSAVPASEIAHLYEKQRTQARGATWFAPIVRRLRDVDDYDFAEGIRKKIEASAVAFVIGAEDDLAISPAGDPKEADSFPKITDAFGNVLEKIAPGLIGYLRGGRDVKFNSPASTGGYEEYKRVAAREIAAGLRIPYEYLTGDLSNVNFTSARVGIVAYRRFCEQVQWQIIVPMLLEPWWRWFAEAAALGGVVDDPDIPVEWDMPKWQAIEPYKDAMSDLINLRLGKKSWPEVVGEGGRNPDDVLSEIIVWNKKFDEADLIFDGDSRKVTMAGVMQKLVTDGASPSIDQPTGN